MYSCPLVFLYPRSPLRKYPCDVKASACNNGLPADSERLALFLFVWTSLETKLELPSPSTSTNKQDFFDQYGMSEELRSRFSDA